MIIKFLIKKLWLVLIVEVPMWSAKADIGNVMLVVKDGMVVGAGRVNLQSLWN